MSYLDTTFSYYPAKIETTVPLGEISLYDYLYKIKNPRPEIVEIFKEIEKASLEGDKKRKAELKQKLWYFTPCVKSDGLGRSYDNITEWNELMIIDFDGLEPEYAIQFKEYLFKTYKFFISVFLSASKKGIKGIMRIPKCQSTDEFKSYFYGVASILQDYKGFDPSSKNCILPNFLTYDENLLYRLDAEVWNRKGIQLDEFKISDTEFEPLENIEQEDIDGIKLMIKRMIQRVDTEQVGHIPIRSVSLLIGGWISYGYMSYDDAIEYLFECMDESNYLQKGMRGYKKTAVEMVRHGMLSALKYEKNER